MMIDAKVFSDVLGMFAPISEDLTVTPTDDGLHMACKSLDSVTMLAIDIDKEMYDSLDAAFTFKLADMRKALTKAEGKAEIVAEGNKVTVRTGRITHRISKYADIAAVKVPDLEMDAEAMVSADALKALVSGRDEEEMLISVSPSGLRISLSDDLDNGVSLDVPAAELTLVSGEATARYPMSHIGVFIKAVPKGVEVDMALCTDYPMCMQMMATGWKAKYLIAPRIEQE